MELATRSQVRVSPSPGPRLLSARPALSCPACPRGGPGAGNLGPVGVRVAPCRTIPGLQVWSLQPGLRWGAYSGAASR